MPYMPFPPNWPVFTPRDKMAAFLESYAEVNSDGSITLCCHPSLLCSTLPVPLESYAEKQTAMSHDCSLFAACSVSLCNS